VVDAAGAGVRSVRVCAQAGGKSVWCDPEFTETPETLSDEFGEFRVSGLRPRQDVRLFAACSDRRTASSAVSPNATGSFDRVTLTLPTLRLATVHVVDQETSRPVSGAAVTDGFEIQASTASDGSATVAIGVGDVEVTATTDDGRRGTALAATLPEVTEIIVSRPKRVRVEVTFEDGSPVPTCSVSLGTASQDVTTPDGTVDLETTDLDDAAISLQIASRVVVTEPWPRSATRLSLRVTDERLRAAGILALRVREPGGRLVARFDALPMNRLRMPFVQGRFGVAYLEASGDFDQVYVWGPKDEAGSALALTSRVADVSTRGGRADVTLTPGLRIAGRVTDAKGAPLVGVALDCGPAGPGLARNVEGSQWTTTDPGGRFEFPTLLDGVYSLTVIPSPDHLAPAPLPVRAGTDSLHIALRGACEALVTVLHDGAPVVDAVVGVWPAGASEASRSGKTDARGRARLDGLDPTAKQRLVVTSTNPDLAPRVLDPWEPRDVVVRLAPAGEIEGVIVDDEGAPVPDAYVRWTQSGEWAHADGDEQGRFRIPHLEPGNVKLQAGLWNVLGDAPISRPTERAVGSRDVRLVLARNPELVVQVSPANERGWEAAWLFAQGAAAPTEVWVSTAGRLRVVRPPEGPLTLWIPPDSAGNYVLATDLRVGASEHVVRRSGLATAITIHRDHSGDEVEVVARRGFLAVRAVAPHRSDPEPIWRFPGLPPGDWEIHASATSADGASNSSADARIVAGEPATLSLTPTR
jgi:hypothetical protein